MKKYNFIFVVLVYRNIQDLMDFFFSLKVDNSKVIVVNSYFDNASDNKFRKIAEENDADYISVPNKGYGAGNNTGCMHAISNYMFDYLVVSNADITINQLKVDDLNPFVVTAPKIINGRDRNQNPAKPFYNKFSEWLLYQNFKNDKKTYLWIALVITKIERTVFHILNYCFGYKRIHEVHGAFIIIPHEILINLAPLFNENMFLFAEEDHLARLLKMKGYKCEYNNHILVYHKEDGSVGMISESQWDLVKESYITYYESWNIKQK